MLEPHATQSEEGDIVENESIKGEDSPEVSVDEEKRVLHKATVHLLPFLSVLYLFCYLDRANLGNAHTEMAKDLNLTESEYALSVSIFYIGYVLCEVPANCMMELVQARRWLARIMITWGIVSVAISSVQGIGALLALRLVLGVAEAGFFPGVVYYMTLWFSKKERASQISILSSSSAMAGLVGGISAYFILQMDGFLGVKGWRWIFILEGIPSIILGFVTLMYLPDGPHEARWLTEEEKEVIVNRLKDQEPIHGSHGAPQVSRALTLTNFINMFKLYISEMKKTFRYPSLWIYGLISFFILIPMSSTPFFLPAVVQEFGTGPMMSNLLSSLPYLIAVILLNLNSRHSDRTKERPFHIIAMCAIGIFGYILVLIGFLQDWGAKARMVAVTIAVAGQWSAMTPFMAWISDYVQGNKAVGIAAINSMGSIAGWAAPSIQARCKEATGSYTLGLMMLGVSLVCTCCTVMIARYHVSKVLQRSKPENFAEMEVLVSEKNPDGKQTWSWK